MRIILGRLVLASLLSTLAVACTDPRAATDAKEVVDAQRRMLNDGYSMLYKDAGSLERIGLLLYVKTESQAVNDLVTDVSALGGELTGQLERIARDYPEVRIDLEPLPAIELRKREAMARDNVRTFAPGVGVGGREYERTLLIAVLNGIDHERHLCRVMAGVEPDASLQKFLRDAGSRYDALYDQADALLNREYFRDPRGTSTR